MNWVGGTSINYSCPISSPVSVTVFVSLFVTVFVLVFGTVFVSVFLYFFNHDLYLDLYLPEMGCKSINFSCPTSSPYKASTLLCISYCHYDVLLDIMINFNERSEYE